METYILDKARKW